MFQFRDVYFLFHWFDVKMSFHVSFKIPRLRALKVTFWALESFVVTVNLNMALQLYKSCA